MIGTFKPLIAVLACVCGALLGLLEPLEARGLSGASSWATQKSARGSGDPEAKAHVPAIGSAERKDIMDGLRGDQKVVFKVHYLKVHGDWAFVDVTPLDDKGKAVAEGGASLMHKESGTWKVMDLSVLPEDPDNPMGPDDPTPKFVKAVQKAFPGTPSDIFPTRARPK